jgi:hypothetical protein
MSGLEKRITVNENSNSSLYEIVINDGGADGGATFTYNVSAESGNLLAYDMDDAVEAFATALISTTPGYTIASIKKFGVSVETL